jgi:hydrogenase maturation protease
VLATDADDALLGAAIVLPDHPGSPREPRRPLRRHRDRGGAAAARPRASRRASARRSRGRTRPCARWSRAPQRATPEDILALHGRTVLRSAPAREPPGESRSTSTASPTASATRSCCASASLRPYDQILDGRVATLERIYFDYDDKLYFGVTVDDDPGQELMRETGRFLFFFTGELEGARHDAAAEKQILVAGIGNAWLRDDGFGGEVVGAWRHRELPAGVTVATSAPAGLDLAYEVMRGYDALVLVDVSRQGGEPGTLYVMEPDEDDIAAGIEDGEMLDPHGMDPQTVLRFVRAVGGWPGKVVVIACEPAESRRWASGSATRSARGRPAPSSSWSRRARALSSRRGHRHRRAPRRRRRVTAVYLTRGPPAPGRARLAGTSTSSTSRAARCARARAWSRSSCRRACAATAGTSGRSTSRLPLPGVRRADAKVVSGEEFLVESIDVEEQEPACTA